MRRRNTTIAIRCTEEESRRIHELAERHGLKLNDFVIRCALGKKIVVANGIDEIVRQQKAIGRNLNQIATLANMDRLTAVNFQPLLDEHRKVTELIGQLLENESHQYNRHGHEKSKVKETIPLLHEANGL